MTHFEIEIAAEPICPWCYIGKRRLDRAIATFTARYPESTFSLVWKPFCLDPSVDRSASFEKKHFYEKRLGDPERWLPYLARIAEAGKPLGINFNIEGRTGSTKNSHKLLILAAIAEQRRQRVRARYRPQTGDAYSYALAHVEPQSDADNLQHRVVERLFRGHFEEGKDLSSESFLLRCARDSKLVDELQGSPGDAEVALLDWLNDPDIERMVDIEVQRTKWRGIEGIPTFTVQEKYRIGGAQEEEVFIELFEKIREAEGSLVGGEVS